MKLHVPCFLCCYGLCILISCILMIVALSTLEWRHLSVHVDDGVLVETRDGLWKSCGSTGNCTKPNYDGVSGWILLVDFLEVGGTIACFIGLMLFIARLNTHEEEDIKKIIRIMSGAMLVSGVSMGIGCIIFAFTACSNVVISRDQPHNETQPPSNSTTAIPASIVEGASACSTSSSFSEAVAAVVIVFVAFVCIRYDRRNIKLYQRL